MQPPLAEAEAKRDAAISALLAVAVLPGLVRAVLCCPRGMVFLRAASMAVAPADCPCWLLLLLK